MQKQMNSAMNESPTRSEILAAHAAERRKRMEGNRCYSFADAERWDLEFWQRRTPQERLSALVSIRRDVEMVERARALAEKSKETDQ